MCGIVLVIIGAIWVMKTMCNTVSCCIRRLCVKSGEHTEEGEESENEMVSTPLSMKPPSVRRTPTRSRDYEEREYAVTMEGDCEEESMTGVDAQRTRPQEGAQRGGTMTRQSSMVRTMKWQGSADRSFTAHETLRQRQRAVQARERQEEQPSSSGSSAIQAVTEAVGEAERAARNALRAADAADRAAESVEKASKLLKGAVESSDSHDSQPAGKIPTNPWNRFQKENASKGWTMDRMRAEYYKNKCSKSPTNLQMP